MRTPERREPGGRGGQGEAGPGARELLSGLLEGSLAFKVIAALLAFTLVPLAEIFLFIYIGHLIGNFLVLALAVVAGAAGALVARDQAARSVERLRIRLEAGRYPGAELFDLAGVLSGGILLVTPGFITDLCGYALMVPRIRGAVGRLVARALGSRFTDLLERLARLRA